MAKEHPPARPVDLLQGTLDMLILRALLFGPRHGHSITKSIELASGGVLKADHGPLYPAPQHPERGGRIAASRGTSENNRGARQDKRTAAGRKQFTAETGKWDRLTEATARALRPGEEEA